MPKRVYWDANVWQSYINGEADRLPVIDEILNESAKENGDLRLVTSELSKVEVAFATWEQLAGKLDDATEKAIDSLWSDRSALDVSEYHWLIGEEARALIRFAITKGWSLKPLDAMHLATAKWLGVNEFHTYDEKLYKFAEYLGFPVCAPYRTQQPLGLDYGTAPQK